MKLSNTIPFAMLALLAATGCSSTDSGLAAPATEQPATEQPAAVKSYDKPGFETAVVKGRLWVFEAGSAELAAFRETGKTPAVHVVRPLAGPDRKTLLATTTEILDAYMK